MSKTKQQNNQTPKVLAVIGARSGSKSIPYKNIYPLGGKPLMAWVIETAKQSRYISRLVVSTDSEEFAKIANLYGAQTPFLRPKEISDDNADDISYLTHATKWLEENEKWQADIILRLPPTTPFCKTESIDSCIELLLNDPSATSARTIKPAPKHPYKLWRVENDELKPFILKEVTGLKEPSNAPRQSFPPAFAHVDVIAVRYSTLIHEGLLTGRRVRFHMLGKDDAIDIDTLNDLSFAEMLIRKLHN